MTTKTFVYFTSDKMFYVKTPSNFKWMFNRNNYNDNKLYECLKSIKETGNDAIRLLYLSDIKFTLDSASSLVNTELGYLTDLTVKIKVKERRF